MRKILILIGLLWGCTAYGQQSLYAVKLSQLTSTTPFPSYTDTFVTPLGAPQLIGFNSAYVPVTYSLVGFTVSGSAPNYTLTVSGLTNPMTSVGDLIVGGTAGAATRLGIGANTYVLTSNGTTATWAAPTGGGGTTTNALTLNNSNSGAASGTTFNGASAVTLSANTLGAGSLANANTWSAVNTFTSSSSTTAPIFANLAITASNTNTWDAEQLYNSVTATVRTAAANSPFIHFKGNAYTNNGSPTGGLADQTHEYWIGVRPLGSTLASTTSTLVIGYSFEGAAEADVLTYSGVTGVLNFLGGSAPGITGLNTLYLGNPLGTSGTLQLADATDGFTLSVNADNMSANQSLSISLTTNAQLTINGNATLNQDVSTAGSPVFSTTRLSSLTTNGILTTGSGNGTLSVLTNASSVSSTLMGYLASGTASSSTFLRGDGTWAAAGGTTTNALTMNNSGSGASSGTTFNGGTAQTLSYNTLGAAGLAATQTFTGVNTFTPGARTSGTASYWTLNTPADTGITAATESIGYQHATATRTWATTGTVALQRENFFAGPTYASASASQTFTDCFTVYITPPIAGTNALFTREHTLGIVDSTSASSSITGGLVVATTLGTSATSVGIGGGNVYAGGTVTGNTLASTVATGTAPLTVTSTTNVANLNASSLNGATFANPGAIGGGTAAAGTFTTLSANSTITFSAMSTAGIVTNNSSGTLASLSNASSVNSTLMGILGTSWSSSSTLFLAANGTWGTPAGTTAGANPTGTVGLTAVNGTATTFLRSDGAPALSQAIAPTWTGVHTFSPAARTSGAAGYWVLNAPADTGVTAATEGVGVAFVGATRTWATTGTVTLQREYKFTAPTYASASASQTFTTAATVDITGAPIAGTNALITNAYALNVEAGTTNLQGLLATTGTFSSTVSGAGITSLFASPPAIGSTTASTGAFTTLSASSTVSGTGFSTYLASPPPIGSTTANTGTFTTMTWNSTGTITGQTTINSSGTSTYLIVEGTGNGAVPFSIRDTSMADGWLVSNAIGLDSSTSHKSVEYGFLLGTTGNSYADSVATIYLTGDSQNTGLQIGVGGVTTVQATTTSTSTTTGALVDKGGIGIAGAAYVGGVLTISAGGNALVVSGGNEQLVGTMSEYKGVNTAGWGLDAIQAVGNATSQTAANSNVCSFTPSADGSFRITANVLVTSAISANFTVGVTYTDEAGNVHTGSVIPFVTTSGTTQTAFTAAGTFVGIPVEIRAKASTAITIISQGTFTNVAYNIRGSITEIQ